MADEINEQQSEEYRRRIADIIAANKEMEAAIRASQVGLKALGKELGTVPGQLIAGMGSFTKQRAGGDTSLKTFNTVIDAGAAAAGGLAKTIPYLGEAISAVIKAVADGAKIVVEKLDETAKAFNGVAASGAAAADGMTGLFKQMNASGLNLQQFQKVVAENSQALARFKGTVGEGAAAFSEITGAISGLGDNADLTLRKIGMNAEQVAETTATYLTQQTRLGTLQGRSNAELAAGAKAYALELDLLTKVTGLNRTQIQKEQDSALSEARFRAKIDTLISEGKLDEAKNAQEANILITAKYGKEAGQGFRDFIALGAATTDASRKLVGSTGGAITGIVDGLKQGGKGVSGVMDDLHDAFSELEPVTRQNALAQGSEAGVFLETTKIKDGLTGKSIKTAEAAEATQKTQLEATDKLTLSTIKAQTGIEQMGRDLNNLSLTFMPMAANAIDAFVKSMEKQIKFLDSKFGAGVGSDEEELQKAKDELAEIQKTMTLGQRMGVGRTQEQKAAYENVEKRIDIGGNVIKGSGGGAAAQGKQVVGSAEAREKAESYLGKKMSDSEFSSLLKATHAEAGGGKQANQQEQAMIMASILNRARDDKGGIMGALNAKNQFQAVTGTSANQNQPSQQFLQGPAGERLASIEGASALLANISTKQRDFTAADSAAYGAGTDISYRDKMLAGGGQTIGGSVFRTSMGAGPNNTNPTASVSGPTNTYSAKSYTDQKALADIGNKPSAIPPATTNPQQAPDSLLAAQLGKMEEMLSVMKNQLFSFDKLVRMQS